MRPVYNGNWSPRSRDQPIQSQHAAYSRPTCAHQSRYGDNFDNNLPSVEDLGPLQQYLGSYNDPNVEANIPSFLQFTNSLADDQGIWLPTPQSHSEYNGVLSHSIARPSGTNQTGGETAGPQQALPDESMGSLYGNYRALFQNSQAARAHRHVSTRFNRQPYRLPEEDSTIADIERNRMHNVGRIYHAMVRGDRAEDNPGSIAMKRWVTCAHYQPDVIEAFAHKVFDCLLAQVKEGFRGWHHNDYVDDDRKGEERDYKVDCEGRLDNIIDALEREKTICEDVMNSGSQIRMFVNAPIAYAARKYQNRLGNSKRGRANMADPNPRPAKKRQGARSNRARSTTVASGGARSRDTTPHLLTSGAVAGPYYRTSHSQHQPATSNPAYSTPRSQPYNLVPPSTSQDLANYTPVPTAAPNPRLRYPSATSQNFAGYIPTTTATAPTPMLRPPSATSQPPAMSRPPHSTSQQRRTYIPPTPPPAHFQTRPSYFPTPPAHFSTPQTSHVPTPSLYPLNHRSPPFPKIDEHSSLSPAPGLWAQQGFAPATAGGYDALPASLVDPLLFGDGGGGGDNGHGGDQGNGGHGSGAGPAGANEDADDLFSQLIWAADLQPGTPAGHMPTHVSLADVEGRGAEAGDAFESFWEQQERVRMFSFEAGGETSGSASARAGAGVGDSKGKGKTKRSGDGGEGDAKGMPKRSGDDYEGVKPKRRSE